MHISNLLTGQSLFQTITQILQATSIGILFGSIYYRSKNIWSVIFLHGLYDFSIMLSDINLVKDCTYGTPSTSIALYSTFASILIILYYIFNALLILRTTDLKEKKKEMNRITWEQEKMKNDWAMEERNMKVTWKREWVSWVEDRSYVH